MDMAVACVLLIALGVCLYVILDGMDLGVGILFLWTPKDQDRNIMMSSIAPVWDGNETWLIYVGGILLAAFPKAYSILLPALYIPIMVLILALILRGIAFEFRLKAKQSRWIWDWSFSIGSTLAAFTQGIILGAIIEGVKISKDQFIGGPFDCFTSFGITTGFSLIFGYALLGSTWLEMKTEGDIQTWARSISKPIALGVMLFILMISIKTPLDYPYIAERWFSLPNFIYLFPLPLLTLCFCYFIFRGIATHQDHLPFICTMAVFILSFLGLGISLWPNIIMPDYTIWQAQAPQASLKFVMVVLFISLPIVFGYSWYVYRIFKGKIKLTDIYY